MFVETPGGNQQSARCSPAGGQFHLLAVKRARRREHGRRLQQIGESIERYPGVVVTADRQESALAEPKTKAGRSVAYMHIELKAKNDPERSFSRGEFNR